jgi:hypothetical protein
MQEQDSNKEEGRLKGGVHERQDVDCNCFGWELES